jgi:hypothetical protein
LSPYDLRRPVAAIAGGVVVVMDLLVSGCVALVATPVPRMCWPAFTAVSPRFHRTCD